MQVMQAIGGEFQPLRSQWQLSWHLLFILRYQRRGRQRRQLTGRYYFGAMVLNKGVLRHMHGWDLAWLLWPKAIYLII